MIIVMAFMMVLMMGSVWGFASHNETMCFHKNASTHNEPAMQSHVEQISPTAPSPTDEEGGHKQ